MKIIALLIILAVSIPVLVQVSTIIHIDNKMSWETYAVEWANSDPTTRPASPYDAYISIWKEETAIPSWIPLSGFAMIFVLLGYAYYDDWKYGLSREMAEEMFALDRSRF